MMVHAGAGAAAPRRLWLIAALVLVTGGWMAFDGAHALITGDFVTPDSGAYAASSARGPPSSRPSASKLEASGSSSASSCSG